MELIFKEQLVKQGNVNRFVFAPKTPLTWQPGQYIHYTLPHENADDRGDERWFTISSAPFENDVWITTRIMEQNGSSFKETLQSLTPGDVITVDEPEGDFVIDNLDQQYVFIAGGIGITPFRSIISQLHHAGKDLKAELLYANRDETSIPFKDELEAISQAHKDFTITYFIGEDRIDESVIREYAVRFSDPIFYVSGPEPMVEAFEALFKEIGIDENNSKFDYFPGYEAE